MKRAKFFRVTFSVSESIDSLRPYAFKYWKGFSFGWAFFNIKIEWNDKLTVITYDQEAPK